MNKLAVSAAFFSSLILAGCGGEDPTVPTPPDSGSPSVPDDSIDYSSFPYAPCGAQTARLYAEIDNRPYRQSPLLFPLEMVREGDEIHLLGGDFEDSEVTTEAVAYNEDPMYVYSGQGSAHLVDRAFFASASAVPYDYPSWYLQELTFWIYSVSDTPVEYEVIAQGEKLQRIGPYDLGLGYSDGTRFLAEKFVTVEPHAWVQVSLVLESSSCIMDSVSITPPTDGSSEFYIDDIQIQGSAEPL